MFLKEVKTPRDISDNVEEIILYFVLITLLLCVYAPLIIFWIFSISISSAPFGTIIVVGTLFGFIIGLLGGAFVAGIYKDKQMNKLIKGKSG